ncbi:TPA_asm: maturation protein [ssRNA phage SRR7976299_10]|uniref:Maturation protein n=1 Tax=ssRNA phage SRR7976299_10 TaxID=2786632 RepID=A0A8S5L4N7_9VIRU|nr:maturation protein [ssRNA phage SRR7976299_10]DAD52641.1 TPA_asm: maturation protein [ssRNA phage SRR7976299_10]
MTSGTKTRDATYTWLSSCGSGKSGSYWTKTWNGADQLPKAVKPVVDYIDVLRPTFKRVPYVDRKGRTRYKREYDGVVSTRRRLTPYVKTPKRERKYDEHNYLMTLFEYYTPPFEFKSAGTDWRWATGNSACGMDGEAWPGHLPFPANAELKLIGKLRKKLVGDFDAGMFLAESEQSLRMIANAAIRIGGAYRAARKGQWQRAENILTKGRDFKRRNNKPTNWNDPAVRDRRNALAANWLELQYGWMPLYEDAYNGAEQLARVLNDPVARTVKTSVLVSDGTPWTTSNPPTTYFLSCRREARKSLKAIITEQNIPLLTGLANPATIAWEVTPFSFVVDWFIPISQYLEARGTALAVTGTFVYSLWQTSEAKGLGITGAREIRGTSGSFWRHKRLERTVTTTLNVPLPRFKPLKKAASWMHTLNALALLNK